MQDGAKTGLRHIKYNAQTDILRIQTKHTNINYLNRMFRLFHIHYLFHMHYLFHNLTLLHNIKFMEQGSIYYI